MTRRRWIGALALLALLLALGLWSQLPGAPADPPAPAATPALAPLPASGPTLAKADPPSGPFAVACPMVSWGPNPAEHIAVMVFTDEDSTETEWVQGTVDEAWLRFEAPTSEGAGLVTLRGYERTSVVWWLRSDGTIECHFPDIPEPEAHGHLRVNAPPDPGPDALSLSLCTVYEGGRTCGGHSKKTNGPHLDIQAAAGTYAVQICRRTGDLGYCHDVTDLTLGPEGKHELEVDWPPPIAGTGVQATPDGDVYVLSVTPDGPGDLAGVEPGSVLFGLHSDHPDPLPSRPGQDVYIGEEGEVVELHVRTPDDEDRVIPVTLGFVNRPK